MHKRKLMLFSESANLLYFFGEQIIDSVHSVHFDDSSNQQKDHPFVIEVRHIVDVVVKQGAEKP